MGATAREWQRLGCAAVLGAVVAFPAGVMFSGRHLVEQKASDPTANPSAHPRAEARKLYSPYVLGDPYVVQKHREIVEALEAACRQTNEGCAEAKEARKYLAEREASTR